MTAEQAELFALMGVVFGLLIWGKLRYDLVAFLALFAAVALGLVPADLAFEGFGHAAVAVVALSSSSPEGCRTPARSSGWPPASPTPSGRCGPISACSRPSAPGSRR